MGSRSRTPSRIGRKMSFQPVISVSGRRSVRRSCAVHISSFLPGEPGCLTLWYHRAVRLEDGWRTGLAGAKVGLLSYSFALRLRNILNRVPLVADLNIHKRPLRPNSLCSRRASWRAHCSHDEHIQNPGYAQHGLSQTSTSELSRHEGVRRMLTALQPIWPILHRSLSCCKR